MPQRIQQETMKKFLSPQIARRFQVSPDLAKAQFGLYNLSAAIWCDYIITLAFERFGGNWTAGVRGRQSLWVCIPRQSTGTIGQGSSEGSNVPCSWMEIDVEGGAGKERWICESKWWTSQKVGRAEVESVMRKWNAVKEYVGEGLRILRLWFFAHADFTEDAEAQRGRGRNLWIQN